MNVRSQCKERKSRLATEPDALRLANCGCPYPLRFHAGEVSELRIEGYPLGVRPDTTYTTIKAKLQEGDYLVFVSDGIPEAVNADREMLGDDRIQATICQGCTGGCPPKPSSTAC